MKKLISWMTTLLILLSSIPSLASTDQKRALIVLTSHSQLGDTNRKTGFWLPELTHPYYKLKDAGFIVDIVSIQGGMAPIDPASYNDKDDHDRRFLRDPELMSKVLRSSPIERAAPDNYNAVIFSGGSGTMWDFPDNEHVNRLSRVIYENNGIVAAICHGPAALIDVKLSNNKYLVAGRKVAAFTNEEEADLKQIEVLPFLLQDKLTERGALHIYGEAWQENIVVDGRLITGQNPASASGVAKEIIEYFETPRP